MATAAVRAGCIAQLPTHTFQGRVGRVARTTKFAVELLYRVKWDRDRPGVGRWMKQEAEEFGPLFVKMMQMVATRGEGLDEEVLIELRKLQDDVQSFDCSEHEDILAAYGASSWDEPIACGSIAAVYKGTDPSNGEEVAVKVKRPGLYEEFSQGLQDSMVTCKLLSTLGVQGSSNIHDMLQEIHPVLLGETDFLREARNAQTFREAMSKVEWVRVPRVIEAHPNSIVMEYIPGEKIDALGPGPRPVAPEVLAIRLSACFMVQLIRTGIFHGDCHSGNISVTEDGSLVFYDLGAMISLGDSPRKYFDKMVTAFLKNDAQLAVDCLAGMGVLDLSNCQEEGDRQLLLRSVDSIMTHIKRLDGNRGNIHTLLQDQKILGRNEKKVFRPTSEFIYLMRNSSMVDAICRKLDPEFDGFDLLMKVLPQNSFSMGMIKEMLQGVASDIQTIRGVPKALENLTVDTLAMNRKIMAGQKALGVWVAVLSVLMLASELM
jgi:predicted unusual protein kinase regulating ubiquinone biosynthesis (AarF/ABC1/UbiB family)